MGNDENTESRIEAAIARLQVAADAAVDARTQGSLDTGEGAADTSVAQENAALKWELEEMGKKYAALKEKTEMVSGRLDKSIGQLSMMLEQ